MFKSTSSCRLLQMRCASFAQGAELVVAKTSKLRMWAAGAVLLLASVALQAQPTAAAQPAAPPAVAPPATPSVTGTNPALQLSPRAIPAPRAGTLIVPNNAVSPVGTGAQPGTNNAAAAPDDATVAISPSPGTTNMAPEEVIPAGFIDFRGVDLNQVLIVYADLVNRTILRPATLASQQIWLKTQTPLTKREAVQALDAVLGMNGVTMINFGDKFVKASVLASTGTEGAPFSHTDPAHLPEFGSYLTHVVQLKYAKPSEMVQVLQPFTKIPNAVMAIDSSQILVLRDFTENIKRMLELIKEVDVVVPSEFVQEVIPIKYAKASEIASALNSLSTGGGGATVGGGGASTGGARTTGSRSGTGFGTGRTGTGFGNTGAYPGQTQPFGAQGATTPGGTQPGGSSFTSRLQQIINKASVTGDIQVLGQTKMIADERTNSLLIYASREDMKVIKDIVAKLDIVLAQVLIEAVIIEVSLNDSRDIGVGYIQKSANGIGSYFNGIGAINPGQSLKVTDFISGVGTTNTTGTGGGLPGGGFSYLASFGQDLDVTLTAVASDSRAKILQRPRIQTSHNEPATIFVGESRPYPTASYYGGGAYGGYSSIQQLQIGVTLDVTPLINQDGLVVMDIHQTIESANGSVNLPNVGDVPITSRKEAQAKVSVRDHDTIILGGLIETSKSKSASGVPYLMNVPVVGWLFRSTSLSDVRSEFIVLIRPTVLPTPEIAALAAKAEKENMPGVRSAEKELRADEARRKRQLDRMEAEDAYEQHH
jgi:general secretion pathway protein D